MDKRNHSTKNITKDVLQTKFLGKLSKTYYKDFMTVEGFQKALMDDEFDTKVIYFQQHLIKLIVENYKTLYIVKDIFIPIADKNPHKNFENYKPDEFPEESVPALDVFYIHYLLIKLLEPLIGLPTTEDIDLLARYYEEIAEEVFEHLFPDKHLCGLSDFAVKHSLDFAKLWRQ